MLFSDLLDSSVLARAEGLIFSLVFGSRPGSVAVWSGGGEVSGN
jgi:hypothetical protein